MDKKELILRAIDNLPRDERDELVDNVQEQYGEQDKTQTYEDLLEEELACPDCDSGHYVKWGKENGRQRFKCKECGRYFRRTSGTVFHDKRKDPDRVVKFIKLAADGLSLRKIAGRLDISVRTAFNWRHEFVEYLADDDELGGIVEVDETYVPYSKKGDKDLEREPRERGMNPGRGISKNLSCILTAKDQDGNLVLRVSGRARPSADELNESLSEYINERIYQR